MRRLRSGAAAPRSRVGLRWRDNEGQWQITECRSDSARRATRGWLFNRSLASIMLRQLTALVACLILSSPSYGQTLRAGAAAIDITPTAYPVLINGGMTAAQANQATTPIHARALALDDGRERLVIVVVDS